MRARSEVSARGLMLMHRRRELTAGETITLVFEFERSGHVAIEAEVRPLAQ